MTSQFSTETSAKDVEAERLILTRSGYDAARAESLIDSLGVAPSRLTWVPARRVSRAERHQGL